MQRLLSLASILICASVARAEVKLCEIFGDSMVLQRDRPIPVWGEAAPGENVALTFAGATASVVAGADGRWSAQLAAHAAGGPFELVAKAANEVRLRDVWVGEVWICAGQSNMGFPLEGSEGGEAEALKAKSKRVRFFKVEQADARERAYHLSGAWQTCSPETARGFSGVGWYFGRELESALDVPIGLIQLTGNGTPAEPWTSRAAMEADPELKPAILRWARKEKSTPGALFNGMVGPLAPFAVRGVAWYQGESNAAQAAIYRKLLPTLIQSWRSLWGDQAPWFLLVQLPGFGPKPKEPADSPWAELREAQSLARKLPNVALCVAIDLGDESQLHPANKRDVGKRLALVAREKVYGQKVESSGPTLVDAQFAAREAKLRFAHAEGGLKPRGGAKVTGFALAGADRVWHWAEARIDGANVTLRASGVDAPVAARYAWADDPECNLENAAGLPAEPFRTDDWPLSTAPKEAAGGRGR